MSDFFQATLKQTNKKVYIKASDVAALKEVDDGGVVALTSGLEIQTKEKIEEIVIKMKTGNHFKFLS